MNKKAYQAPACTAFELQIESGILYVSGIDNGDGTIHKPGNGDDLDDDIELFSRGQGGWSSESWK